MLITLSSNCTVSTASTSACLLRLISTGRCDNESGFNSLLTSFSLTQKPLKYSMYRRRDDLLCARTSPFSDYPRSMIHDRNIRSFLFSSYFLRTWWEEMPINNKMIVRRSPEINRAVLNMLNSEYNRIPWTNTWLYLKILHQLSSDCYCVLIV